MKVDHQKPHVLLVGTILPQTIENTWYRWLIDRGYRTTLLDQDQTINSIAWGNDQISRLLWKVGQSYLSERFSRRFLSVCLENKPDLILVVYGRLINKRVILELKSSIDVVIFNFYGEDFMNPLNTTTTLREAAVTYDHFFTTKSFNVPELNAAGINNVTYLPCGYLPACHYPVTVSVDNKKKYGSDLVFIGTWENDRATIMENLVDYDLGIWGNLWEKLPPNSPLHKGIKGPAVYCEEMSKVINSSKICLSFLRKGNRDQHTQRTFEIPACGGFQLSERTDEVLGFFEEGKEIECFSTLEELRSKVEYYLQHDNPRKKIAKQSYLRVQKSSYSYIDRLGDVLSFYDLYKN